MPPRAAAKVTHLTDDDLAVRWRLDVQVIRTRRRNGDCPRYLLLTEGSTKQTIRYPLTEVEAYEATHLIETKAMATA